MIAYVSGLGWLALSVLY